MTATLSHAPIQATSLPARACSGGAGKPRLQTIDSLRGIAALLVAWFHFSGQGTVTSGTLLQWLGKHGHVGVEIFFAISGFVVPLAMWRNGYQLSHKWQFLAKRAARLYPPYLAAFLITLILDAAGAFLHHKPLNTTLTECLLHLGYLPTFFGYSWLNMAYWTLAVEAVFCGVICFLFPVIVSARWQMSCLLLLVWMIVVCAIPGSPNGLAAQSLFVPGILAFLRRTERLPMSAFVIALLVTTAFLAWQRHLDAALAGAGTALLLSLPNLNIGWFSSLGSISYSLYLIHSPIGQRARYMLPDSYDHLFGTNIEPFAALVLSLGASVIFWMFIENPATLWSSRIRSQRLQQPAD